MTTAKLFINGKSQAVRIPKSMEFEGINEVKVRRDGNKLIIEPAKKTWTSFTNLPAMGDDFMKDRPELTETDRVQF